MATFDAALWEEDDTPPGATVGNTPHDKVLTLEAEPAPEGWEYDDEERQPNAIEALANQMAPVTGLREPLAFAGRGLEEGLGQLLHPVVSAPAELANVAEGALARAGGREPDPYAVPTGKEAAAALLSPGAARLALETGASMAATAATGGAAGPATIGRLGVRLLAAAGGGAVGSLAAEPIDPSGRPVMRAAEAALFSVGGEAVGSALNRVIRGGTRLIPGGARDMETIQGLGGTLSPGQVSANPIITTIESLAEQGLTGGGTLAATRQKATDLATAAANDFVEASLQGASREDVGILVADSLKDAKQAFSETAGSMYDQVDELTGGARVDLSGALELAQKIAEENPRLPAAQKLVKWIEDEIERGGEEGLVGFGAAQRLRSDLLGLTDLGGDGGMLIRGQAEAAAKRITKSVDGAMETAAKGVGADAYQAFRTANSFYKDGAQTFSTQMIRALARAEPEEVFRIGIKNASPEAVERLISTIGDDATWERIRGLTGRHLIDSATSDGVVSGSKLVNAITSPNGPFSPKKMEVIYGRAGADNFTRIARALKAAQSETGQHIPGGVRMRWYQSGGAIGIGGIGLTLGGPAGAAAGAATVFVAPALAMKFMTKGKVAHWLTVGLRAKPGSELARRAFSQLAAHAAEIDTDEYGPEAPLPTVTPAKEMQ